MARRPGRYVVVGIAALAATIALVVDFADEDDGRPSLSDPRDPAVAPARTGTIALAGSRGTRALPPIRTGELRLEGLVVDDTKQPVAGATVTLGGTRTVTTEDDGSFAFDHLAEAEYDLTAATSTAYTEEREQRLTADSDPVTLELRRSASVVVRVVAAENGAPIADAKVSTSDRVAYTDERGLATLRSIATGMTRIEANADGRAESKIYVSTDDPAMAVERTIELGTGSDLSGLVVDAAGKPVPEASVSLETNGGQFRAWATADDHGHWEFHAIAAGKQVLSAFADKHIATDDLAIETDGLHPKTDVVVRVDRGGEIVGVVVDAAGKPVAGAKVRGYGSAETDQAGRFTLAGVPPGNYEVAATTEHSASPEFKLDLARGATATIRLVMGEGTLAGRVVDTHGIGTGDATVNAIHVASGRKWHAYVDDNGAFDFGGIEPGEYKLTVERTNVSYPDDPPGIIVRAGNRKLRLVLPDVAKLVGRVMLGGKPVTNFGLSIAAVDSYFNDATPVRSETGRFERSDVVGGTWTVTIVGPDFAKRTIANVRTVDGQTTDLGDIVVAPARVITGRVVDAAGKPLPGARVEVADGRFDDDDTMGRLLRDDAVVRTDASGAFRIANLPASSTEDLRILATHPTAGATLPRVLAPTETALVLVIEATGAIEGTIANYNERQHGAVATRVGSTDEIETSLDGSHFLFTQLPAGEYEVRLRGANTLAPVRVAVVAGGRARVTFALPRVPVTLQLDHPGCTTLTVRDSADREVGYKRCKAGRAEISDVAPGRYQVCRDANDYIDDTDPAGATVPCTTIEVRPDVATQTFDV